MFPGTLPIGLFGPQSDAEIKALESLLYVGNGGSQSISGAGFAPDLVWIKDRSAAKDWAATDIQRGATKNLLIPSEAVQSTQAEGITSFDSDGFSIGNYSNVNTLSNNYVAWCWNKAPAAGLDVVTYTGTGGARTVNHNLGKIPRFIVVKALDRVAPWTIYHVSLGAGSSIEFNGNAPATSSAKWNNTSPTTTNFSLGGDLNLNGSGFNYIAYVFAEANSKFGAYSGNGSTSGPIVTTGFTPKLLVIVRSSGGSWLAWDSKRSPANPRDKYLYLSATNAEEAGIAVDFLADGFQIRSTSNAINRSGSNFLYMTWG